MKTYPKDHFHYSTRKMGHDKTYKHCGRPLIVPGEKEPFHAERLAPLWHDLCQDLLSDEYRNALEELIGVSLKNHIVGVDFWRFDPGDGCFISPHADVPWKTVSHIYYFVREWDPSWGGMLGVHDVDQQNDRIRTVTPSLGTSAILVRSERSFHSIEQVSIQAKETRRVMDVVFFNKMPPAPRPGRIESEILPEEMFVY
jgi:hypothetical protein